MIDIGSIIALCETALSGIDKAIEAYKKRKLSKEEDELLIAASQRGEFHLMSIQQSGTWVRVDSKDFRDDNDPAIAALYLEAFRSLCKRGYIIHEGDKLFMLTGSGFMKARELTKNTKSA